MRRLPIAFGVVAALVFVVSLSSVAAQQAKKKEFVFHGTVEKVDTKDNRLAVNGDKVDGWMAAMSMIYKVDKPDALKTVKAGDQITAKVYEGDFETLYDVQRVAPKGSGK